LSAANRSNLPPPTLVEDERGFDELMEVLRGDDLIAVDTEADSFYRYRERVCLIQMTAGEQDFLIDPLMEFDLAPLGEIFADESKVKIFHDGEYDVLILKRDFDFRFAGLFDTRIAAAALGFQSPGLASVVKDRFGVELDKTQQRSNWSKRPLTELQIAYAREDTRYLIPLMHQLIEELDERGRAVIVEGECRRLEALEPAERSFDPDGFIRLKGARGMTPHQMSALRELFILRDDLARARDVPPFKVLGNNALLAIAEARPRGMRPLEQVEGLSPKIAKRLGSALLGALRSAEDKGPLRSTPRPVSRTARVTSGRTRWSCTTGSNRGARTAPRPRASTLRWCSTDTRSCAWPRRARETWTRSPAWRVSSTGRSSSSARSSWTWSSALKATSPAGASRRTGAGGAGTSQIRGRGTMAP